MLFINFLPELLRRRQPAPTLQGQVINEITVEKNDPLKPSYIITVTPNNCGYDFPLFEV